MFVILTEAYLKRRTGKRMTVIYFVRHAEPNFENHNDSLRELSEKGLEDRKLVTQYLQDKRIDKVLSSPYKRAVDTVKDFADKNGLAVETIEDFRERKIDSVWIDNFAGSNGRIFNISFPTGKHWLRCSREISGR